MNSTIELLTVCCIGFGLSFALKLFIYPTERKPRIFLGFFVLILSGCTAEIFIRNPIVGGLLAVGYWLLGPLLYLYCKHRTANGDVADISIRLHCIPALVYLILLVIPQPFSELVLDTIDVILYEAVFIHILVYFTMALRLSVFARMDLTGSATIGERMHASFLIFLPAASLVLFCFSFLVSNLALINNGLPRQTIRNIIQALLTLVIFFIALLNTETRPTTLARR